MSAHEYEVGLHKNDLDTPALLIDLAAMERNLQTMADYLKKVKVNLRPHVKLHKATPVLAHMQLQAGAVGLTCAKLSEAEVLVAAGIRDVLIANQIVGERKIRRLVNLAAHSDVMVAVDDSHNVTELSEAAQAKAVTLRVLVEVDIGNKRCGVEPFEPTLEISRTVLKAPGLKFMGLMGYDGHCTFLADVEERYACSNKANQLLVATRECVERAGIPVQIVSAGGTLTYKAASRLAGITEIQAGTYLLMDSSFKEKGLTEFECALSVLATVTSRPPRPDAENLAIIDVGRKTMEVALGLPEVKEPAGATVTSMPQEHARLKLEGASRQLRIGDKVELWVRDANCTINLHDKFYAIRNDIVEAVWDIPGRGRAS